MNGVRAYFEKALAFAFAAPVCVYFFSIPEPETLYTILMGIGAALLSAALAYRIMTGSAVTVRILSTLAVLGTLNVLAFTSLFSSRAAVPYAIWGAALEPGTLAFFSCLLVWAAAASVRSHAYVKAAELFIYVCSAGSLAFLATMLFGAAGSSWDSVVWIDALALIGTLAFLAVPRSRVRTALMIAAAIPLLLVMWACAAALPVSAALAGVFAVSVLAPGERTGRIVQASCGALLISMLLFGSTIAPFKKEPVVYPSHTATMRSLAHTLFAHPAAVFTGSGPLSFAAIWDANYSAELNASPLALKEVRYGNNAILTLVAEFGVLAAMMFLSAIAFALADIPLIREERARALLVAGTLVSSLIALIFADPPAPFWYATAISIGAAAAYGPPLATLSLTRPLRRALALGLIACVLYLGWAGSRQFASYVYHSYAVSQESTGARLKYMERAVRWWQSPHYLRDASRAALIESLRPQLFGAPPVSVIEAGKAEQYASDATRLDPLLYESWLVYATERVSRALAGDPSAFEGIDGILTNAATVSPQRPEIPYLFARIAHAAGDDVRALEALRASLSLKSDYAEALELYRVITETNADR